MSCSWLKGKKDEMVVLADDLKHLKGCHNKEEEDTHTQNTLTEDLEGVQFAAKPFCYWEI